MIRKNSGTIISKLVITLSIPESSPKYIDLEYGTLVINVLYAGVVIVFDDF